MPDDRERLLGAGDPAPVRITNPARRSAVLLIGDHAGDRIPVALGTLGLDEEDRRRHIAWDIGIAALGAALATALDATFIEQVYSRLVVDCNRGPEAADAICGVSDGTVVPGNQGLTDDARAARFAAVHAPYHAAIADMLAARDAAGGATTLVALHSFTPVMRGVARPWEVGILHHRGDPAFALGCLARLRARGDLCVGDNQPYAMDGIDYSIPRHAYPARRPYVEFEIRQDLLADPAGIAHWAGIVAGVLTPA